MMWILIGIWLYGLTGSVPIIMSFTTEAQCKAAIVSIHKDRHFSATEFKCIQAEIK